MRRMISDVSAAIALLGFTWVVVMWGSVLAIPAVG